MGQEARLQSAITKFLRSKDRFVNKTQGGNPGTDTGTPDIITIDLGGRLLGLEIKRPDGHGIVSPEQKAIGKQIIRNGGRWEVIDSFEKFEEAWQDVTTLI
ncbi:VRR-NUC domain-containing protein [Leuconostoc carnosum]|uniref:VRR-NUC domain-containing protein n=1 Tax=Leuconostoc carnosum TaxID=1252 RepID=UPI00123BC226|nr:VRR-NUC domain-containing protein [Leuconostoc carnosum]KAA8327818.1 VRR-NUC domain-containing protein [Leuconostoc carnosum]KAA8375284.1 VRR-NUC domain-containing protein [Leuconostoc carnosum]